MTAMTSVITLVVAMFVLQATSSLPLGVIEGVVVDDSTGQPLPEASVALSTLEGNPVSRSTTNTDGRFLIRTDRAGRFLVTPAKSGLIWYPPNPSLGLSGVWVELTENTQLKKLELRMGKPGTISGTILGADGRPTPNVAAHLLRHTYDRYGRKVLGGIAGGRLARATDRGEFRLYDLLPGEYYVGIFDENQSDSFRPNFHLFLPDLTPDGTRAVPISVKAGEEVRLQARQIPPLQNSMELRLRITAPFVLDSALIDLGGNGFSVSSTSNLVETTRRIQPGRYDVLVTVLPPRTPPAMVSQPLPNYYYYAAATLDAVGADIVQDLALKPMPILSGKILVQTSSGEPVPPPAAVGCFLEGRPTVNCVNSRVLPGPYRLEFRGLSPHTYVLAARANGRDLLTQELSITEDTAMEILLAENGASIDGTARTAAGKELVNGIVVLVPEEPYRRGQLRDRSVVTNPDGKYELHGIAPGSYKAFALTELPGEAFRNAEFMREFEDRGKAVNLKVSSHETIDLAAF